MSAVALQLDNSTAAAGTRQQTLRKACNEFVSMATFAQMLRQTRESKLNSGLWNSSAQKIFQGQLDDVLLQRSSDGLGRSIGEGLYRQLSGTLGNRPAAIDTKA